MDSPKPFEFTMKIEGDEFAINIDGDRRLSVKNNSQNRYEISFKDPQGGQTQTMEPEGVASYDLANPNTYTGLQISVKNLGCEDPSKK